MTPAMDRAPTCRHSTPPLAQRSACAVPVSPLDPTCSRGGSVTCGVPTCRACAECSAPRCFRTTPANQTGILAARRRRRQSWCLLSDGSVAAHAPCVRRRCVWQRSPGTSASWRRAIALLPYLQGVIRHTPPRWICREAQRVGVWAAMPGPRHARSATARGEFERHARWHAWSQTEPPVSACAQAQVTADGVETNAFHRTSRSH